MKEKNRRGHKKQITPMDVVRVLLWLQEFDSDCGDVITNLKAQKLVYYVQGLYLAKTEQPLFEDDFLAWMHGPVIETLYQRLKDFGSSQIKLDDDGEKSIEKFNDQQLNLIVQVYKTFGRYSAWALRDMTHQESPWKDTPRNQIIEKSKIMVYFQGRKQLIASIA